MNKSVEKAIEDAKALREMAVANAQIALEESFRDRVEELVNEKIDKELSEMDDYEDEEDSDDEVAEKVKTESKKSSVKEEENKTDSADGEDLEDEEDSSENLDEMDDEEEDEEDEDTLGLDEIIAELEAELDEGKVNEEEDEDSEDEEDSEEMNEEEDSEEEDEESFDLDELLKSIDEMEFDYNKEVNEESEINRLRSKLAEVKKENEELKGALTTMSETMNEVNLLNAKLLYANKLFRGHSLTNEQKVKVIETLDRTNSVREVKLVFTTLAESLRFDSTKSKGRAQSSIVEGLSSKPVGSTAPGNKTIISENSGNEFTKRIQHLAGIIKS